MVASLAAPGHRAAGAQMTVRYNRPGQPADLTMYDKGMSGIPVPGQIFRQEAERLSEDFHTPLAAPLSARPIPKSSGEFAYNRKVFERQMSDWRKKFRAEVADKVAREAAAVQAFREAVVAKREASRAFKAAKKEARATASANSDAGAKAAASLSRELSLRAQEMRDTQLKKRRAAWLDALEEDSAQWVPEGRIDELITPDLFSVKYSWQFVRWFEVKEQHRMAQEAARRAKKPGEPLREVQIEDKEYSIEWESEPENELNEGAATAEASARSLDAGEDGSSRVSLALELARRAAWAKGKAFPEPNYTEEADEAVQSGVSAGGVTRMRATGVQPEDLYFGKSVAQLVEEYEKWIAGAAKEVAAAAGADSAAAGSLDSGERRLENAYIDYCVASENVEALYYALLRKRARLAQGAKRGDYPSSTLEAFDGAWKAWTDAVESAIAGEALPVSVSPADFAADEEGKEAVDRALSRLEDRSMADADGSSAANMAMDDKNIALGLAMKNGFPEQVPPPKEDKE